jgi:hypothetical protein
MSAAASSLLAELRQRGVEIVADGDMVRYRPPRLVPPELHRRIVDCKPGLLTILRRQGRALRAANGPTAEGRSTSCFCCGGREFWALADVRHWVCARCHEPDCDRDGLLWISVSAAEAQLSGMRPMVACLSCGGAHFVRLKNGRRSVCARCERTSPEEIAGSDDGMVVDGGDHG